MNVSTGTLKVPLPYRNRKHQNRTHGRGHSIPQPGPRRLAGVNANGTSEILTPAGDPILLQSVAQAIASSLELILED